MLPAQREIEDYTSKSMTAPAFLLPGKMVDSVDGLCQRLQDIDLDQITSALERLSDLRERLLTLQKMLGIVTEVSACNFRVRHAQDRVNDDLNPLKVEILEILSQLREKTDTNELIAIGDVQKDLVSARGQPASPDYQSVVPPDARSCEPGVPVQFETDQTVTPIQAKHDHTEVSTLTGKIITDDHAPNNVADITGSYRGLVSVQIDVGPADELSDNDFLEEARNSNLDFDFADDGLENPVTQALEESHEPFSPKTPYTNERDASPRPTVDTNNFDQKLLDDLIKNYGEFAASPDLPNTVELANPSAKFNTPNPSKVPGKPSTAIDRPVPAYQNHGELDAKLKKLIRDYGEVDLYPQPNSVKTKLRALGAFVVLGVVLSGIYYFSGPKTKVESSPSSAESRAPDSADQAVADSPASIDKKTARPAKEALPMVGQDSPQSAEASESLESRSNKR